tara:strand:- start:352 stop:468 length:117 start_codon:yes stop_codon:yes gene_type:complete
VKVEVENTAEMEEVKDPEVETVVSWEEVEEEEDLEKDK